MSWPFALILQPALADDSRTDFADTFQTVNYQAPALPVANLGTQRGDGVFETIGVADAHPQEVTAHLERLAHSAALCDLPTPNLDQWRQAIRVAAQACPQSADGVPVESVIKLILSRGISNEAPPAAWVTASPAQDFSAVRQDGMETITLDRGYDLAAGSRAPWLLLGAKTLSYAQNMAALREANRRGAGDALFISSDGYLLEGATASVILRLKNGEFITPKHGTGILAGTTQISVFEYLTAAGFKTTAVDIPVAQLTDISAAWLVSSVRLAAPITAIDGASVPVDAEITHRINNYLLSQRD